MALEKRHSISTFVIEFLWILFLVFQECNLVICDGFKDDSLKKALEAVERRQRDLELQENDYYGQPENIGYGFQKTLGFFDNAGPAPDLGSFDADLENLPLGYGGPDEGDYGPPLDKRTFSLRERTPQNRVMSQRGGVEDYPQGGLEYLQLVRNLWEKYRQSRPDDFTVEDLTDDQVEEILDSLYQKGGGEGRYGNDYDEPGGYSPVDVIPVRSRKNYRVFDGFGGRDKRYPGWREGARGGKRNSIGYYGPPENDFLYSLKFVNPEWNREAVENLREGFEAAGEDKDRDVMGVLESGRGRHGEEDEPFWVKDEEEEDAWLPGPVALPEGGHGAFGENDKRGELVPRVFKNHEGIHLTGKRFPVKRSPVRVRKEVKNEKVSKEVKGIFSPPRETTATTPAPRKVAHKPTEAAKKNATKPEVTKHHQAKKVIRRSDKYSKEVFPAARNEDILDIFSPAQKTKKSIDWSRHFGLDKRTPATWLRKDHLSRAEGHLPAPKTNTYEIPFDTRTFNDRSFSHDIGSNIDRVEDRIGDMEEKIIDDAVKYTGAHSGGGPENLTQVKNKLIRRLEAAYSLEKMKNALEEFKTLVKPPNTGQGARKASTEPPRAEARTSVPKESSSLEKPLAEKSGAEVRKRVASKKEAAREGPSDGVEFLNKVYGRKQQESEGCPVLERILRNCLRVEAMWGRYTELLVPLCSLQQMCYFCGPELGFSKMSTCDAVYLSEARNVCQDDSDCLVSARNSMLALQDLYEQDLFSRSPGRPPSDSCLANPCIQRYFSNAPGSVYPPEMHK